jgi:hypothetical protein
MDRRRRRCGVAGRLNHLALGSISPFAGLARAPCGSPVVLAAVRERQRIRRNQHSHGDHRSCLHAHPRGAVLRAFQKGGTQPEPRVALSRAVRACIGGPERLVVHGDVEGRALTPGEHLRLHEPGAQRGGAAQHGRARGVVALAAHPRAADAVPVAGVRLGARMCVSVARRDFLDAVFTAWLSWRV